MYMLDTNTATYILGGRSVAARGTYKQHLDFGHVAISVITQAEILFGIENKPEATRLRAAIDSFLGSIEILVWDSAAAFAYARLRARMNAAGKNLSAIDMLIAAHAVSVGAVLVTRDQAFRFVVPMLDVVDWATDL